MVEKQRYSLDSADMRSRVRGYAPRPITAVTPRMQRVDKLNTAQVHAAVPTQQLINTQKVAKSSKKFLRKPTLKSVKFYSLASAAAFMVVIGGFLSYQGYRGNQQVAVQAKALAESAGMSSEDDKPANNGNYDETPPPVNLTTYTVASDMPRFASIPELGVFARVKRAGTLNDNSIEAPKNVFDIGWYDGSSKPGEPGLVFLDGHVSGPTKGGVFANLKRINIGSKIIIERGDGKKITYRVEAKELFDADKVDMVKALRPYDNTRQGLNIMTCNGKFDVKTQTFDKRIVVYAVAE